MARNARKPAPPFDLVTQLPALAEALRSRRALKGTDLAKLGVPAARRAEALGLLVESGGEPFKGGVRVPIRRQLGALADATGVLPLSGLAKRLAGASQPEAKATAEALAREGALRVVLRGKIEVVVPSTAPVLEAAELRALARVAKALAAQAEKALRSSSVPKTLLRADVREPLLELIGSRDPREARRPLTAAHELPGRLLEAVQRAVRPELGLAYVPDVMRGLIPIHPIDELHAALLEAASARKLELRPESGLSRLTPEELALCPPGAHGTRLSWARILPEVVVP